MPALKLVPRATFYDVLGLEKDCATDDIRKAYRRRALETHPDKLEPSASEAEKQAAEEQFHKVQEAFEALGDPRKRRRYDALLAFRTDPALISEDSARRTADRKEWSRQQQEMIKRRIDGFKIQLPRTPPASPASATIPTTPNTPMTPKTKTPPMTPTSPRKNAVPKSPTEPKLNRVADILQDLMNANPEFAARREAILKRKAERERIEREKQQQQTPLSPTMT